MTQVILLPQAHPMLASVILHLLLAQLAWTLTVVNLMQPTSYRRPLTRESTKQTGMLDHRRGANMMRTTLSWVSLILGVVPFLSHCVLYVQKDYLTTR
jgi:hypothetical protein